MTDITNIEDDLDKYNAIKEYLREFYKNNITGMELLLIVFLIENPGTKACWQEVRKKMPLYSKGSFYRSIVKLNEMGIINPVVKTQSGERCIPEQTVTYIMFDGSCYKIGRSKRIINRYKAIKANNSNIELITFVEGDVEAEMHSLYAENKIRGEWFKFSRLEFQGVIKNLSGLAKSELAPEEEVEKINSL